MAMPLDIPKLQEASKNRYSQVTINKRATSTAKMIETKKKNRIYRAIIAKMAEHEARIMENILISDMSAEEKKQRRKKDYPAKEVDFRKVKKAVILVEESKPLVRPPAVYSNIISPYGIAAELMYEQLKRSG